MQKLDMKYLRPGLLKHAGMTNKWISEQLKKNVSTVNREISGWGGHDDTIRKFIWKQYKQRTGSDITYKVFWGKKFSI